ncbi:unnamed protein product, partial [Mesorhabditis spiculigera]
MLVLVTGAAGFIGSHTVLELIEAGYEVYCIDNFSNSISDESGNALSLKRVEELTGKKIAFEKADDWNIVILRYFNPVGAHPSGKIGEDPQGIPNNLMPFVSQVAIGRLPAVSIFGTKWATPDGTGVRDYIHIVDLAKGHVKALDRIKKEGHVGTEIFNLGTGRGYSVLEMPGTRRLDTLVNRTSGKSSSQVEKLIMTGKVRVNEDSVTKKSYNVQKGDIVDIWGKAHDENSALALVDRAEVVDYEVTANGYDITIKHWRNFLVDNWRGG